MRLRTEIRKGKKDYQKIRWEKDREEENMRSYVVARRQKKKRPEV